MSKFFVFACCLLWLNCTLAQSGKYNLAQNLSDKDFLPHTLLVKFKVPAAGKTAVASGKSALLKSLGGTLRPAFPNLKNSPVLAQKSAVSDTEKARQQHITELSQVYFLNINPKISLQEAIQQLLQDENVIYAEPVFQNYTPLYIPNDPQNVNGYQFDKIHAYEAWDVQKGSPSMVIGMIDSGFELTHEDLVDNMVPGRNVADNNMNFSGGDRSHGTFSSGFASATPDNGKGITGIGYNCKFMPVRYTSDVDPSLFAGYEGIIYAVDNGCKVICLPWGRNCGGFAQSEQDIINYAALVKDAVVVVSAGNLSVEIFYYPASYDNVISVGFTDVDDNRSVVGGSTATSCGTFGRGSTFNSKVKIMAPGRSIFGTAPGNSYAPNTGSSFSAPLVAGAAALVRVQFPALTARQVIQRLAATADNIYNAPLNVGLEGKLGTGRLNVYRALTEASPKSAEVTRTFIKSTQNQPYLLGGQVTAIRLEVTNFLAPLGNLQVKLTGNSPFVEVRDSLTTFGAMPSGKIDTNKADPFLIYVNPAAPSNLPVSLKAVFTDGTYSYTQLLSVTVNPDFLDVNVNQLLATVTSKGRLAFNDDANTQGNGYNYRSQDGNLLYEGGLMAGISATRTADAVRVTTGTRNQSFQSVRSIAFAPQPGIDFSATAVFADTSAPAAEKVGLLLTQNTLAWKDAPHDKYFIEEYKVKNIGKTDFPALYLGWFADWDIQGYANNAVSYDSTLQLGYAFNTIKNNAYAGIALLSLQSPQFYALDYDYKAGVWVYDSFTKAEKFQTISSGVFRKQSTPNTLDVAFSIGAGTDSLKSNQSQTIAFAFVAGDNLNDLKTSVLQAQVRYRQFRTSPLPVLTTVNACYNDSVKIIPQNGKIFRFYNSATAPKPVFTGSVLRAGKALKDTVYYVAGADSVFESQRVAVSVKVFSVTAGFSNTGKFRKDTLVLPVDSTMNFTDKSSKAIKWNWNFGDGTTSTLQNPLHTYKALGNYTVTLTAENTNGCQSIFSRNIRVLDLTTAVEPPDLQPFVRIYPVPAQNKVFLEKSDSLFDRPCQVEVISTLGQAIKAFSGGQQRMELDLSGTASGVYFLKITIGSNVWMKKIVLQ